MKENEVKCLIINNDISIYSYELIKGCGKMHQVEMIGKSGKRYILAVFSTLKEAKDFCERINR